MVIDLRRNKRKPGKEVFTFFAKITKNKKSKNIFFQNVRVDADAFKNKPRPPSRAVRRLAPEPQMIQSNSVLGKFFARRAKKKRR